MRFNSYEFIFVFLPLAWLGWRAVLRWAGLRAGVGWMALASLVFYARWDWRFAPLLVLSLMVNYGLGRLITMTRGRRRTWYLVAGLIWNLGLLGYFKYWDFLLGTINALTGTGLHLEKIILPLGISFFTFQKIAFLVDAWRGRVKEVRFMDFALFVMFFPQLIAGPIVHHSDFIPQIREEELLRFNGRRFCLGLLAFSAGLFQKCIVADLLSPLADSAFGLTAQGTHLRLLEGWTGVLAYTFQLFYDFAGYSHMAIGLALMFGFRLPINFLAPYTSRSLVEFWHRWHITLSNFLRDYLYIPLGGNRTGHLRNLFITLVLAGLWHGAGWTFVLWGAWHGVALIVNHVWRKRRKAGPNPDRRSGVWAPVLTLAVVVFGWVLFRAHDLPTAWLYIQSMLGWHGITVPVSWQDWVAPLAPVIRARGLYPNLSPTPTALILLVISGYLALRGPKLLAWLGLSAEDVTPPTSWQAAELAPKGTPLRVSRALIGGLMLVVAIAALARSAPFLYFQF